MAKSKVKSNVVNQFARLVYYSAVLPVLKFIGDSLWGGKYSTVKLGRAFTKAFLEEIPRLPGDRERSRKYNTEVRYDMQHGFFNWSLVMLIKVYVRETKTWYRINGNTTVSCIHEIPLDTFIPEVRMAEYAVNTMDEARALFTMIDRARPRTKSQCVCAMLMGSPGYCSMSRADVGLLQKALNHYLGGGRYDLTVGELWFLLRKGGEFYDSAQNIRTAFSYFRRNGELEYFRRAPVVAAMFPIFKKYGVYKAMTFFKELFSPKRKAGLVDELGARLINIIVDRGARKKKEMRSEEEVFRIVAWFYEWTSGKSSKASPTKQERDDCYEKPRPGGYEGRKR
jgi:hypothetical protein